MQCCMRLCLSALYLHSIKKLNFSLSGGPTMPPLLISFVLSVQRDRWNWTEYLPACFTLSWLHIRPVNLDQRQTGATLLQNFKQCFVKKNLKKCGKTGVFFLFFLLPETILIETKNSVKACDFLFTFCYALNTQNFISGVALKFWILNLVSVSLISISLLLSFYCWLRKWYLKNVFPNLKTWLLNRHNVDLWTEDMTHEKCWWYKFSLNNTIPVGSTNGFKWSSKKHLVSVCLWS